MKLVMWNIKSTPFKGKRQYEEGIGLLKLAQLAKSEGHNPIVLQDHNYGTDPEYIMRRTNELSPDLLCYSVMSHGVQLLQKLVCFAAGKNVPVVLGGPAVTINPHSIYEIFKNIPAHTAMVRGDGEDLFRRIITTPVTNWADIDGLYFLSNGILKEGAYQQCVLDDSPFADLESSDQRNIAAAASQDKSISLEERIAWTRSLFTTQIESRKGCYYSCEFCSTSSMPDHKVRKSGPKRLVDEMVYQFNKGISFFALTDNIAFDIPGWWLEFSNILMSTGIAPYIQFGGYGTPRMLDKQEWEQAVPELYNVGLRSIILGIQAGSARILKDIIHRPADDPQRALSIVNKYVPLGINVKLDFIVGHPTETKSDLQETLDWVNMISDAGGEVFVRELNVVPQSGYELHLRNKDYALPEKTREYREIAGKILNNSFGDQAYLKLAFGKGIPNKYLIDRELGIKYPTAIFSIEELKQSINLLQRSNIPSILKDRYEALFELVITQKMNSPNKT